MKSWLVAHVQACVRALKRLRAQPASAMLSVFVIGIAIMLPVGLYTIFTNVTSATARINTEPNVNVYLVLKATEAEARELEKRLRALPNAKTVTFISRDAALAEMKRVGSVADLLAAIDANPLPHAITIKPASADPESLAAMRKAIVAMPLVEQVGMDFEWAQKLTRFANFAERIVLLLGAVLSVAVVFVTGNTIRLQILTQKEEIEVSQLIGATQRFIRRPYLYFGASQGLLAGLFALLAVAALLAWAGAEVQALAVTVGAEFTLRGPSPMQSLLIIASAGALGWLGAFVSVWLYLRRIQQ